MKHVLVALGAVLSAGSWAAFDFQFQSRYSSAAIVDTTFERVRCSGTNAFVAGKVGDDILIAKFDAYGSMVASYVWDTPLAESESINEFDVTAAGKVVIQVQGASNEDVYVIQLNSSLGFEWERQINPVGTLASVNTDVDKANGRIYASVIFGSTHRLLCLDSAGNQLFSRDMTPATLPFIRDIEAVESTTGPGVVLCGALSSQAWIGRYDGTLNTVYSRSFNGSASSFNGMASLYVTGGGVATAAGQAWDGSDAVGALYAVTTGGTITRSLRSESSNMDGLQFVTGGLFRCRMRLQVGGYEVVDIDRSSGNVTKRKAVNAYPVTYSQRATGEPVFINESDDNVLEYDHVTNLVTDSYWFQVAYPQDMAFRSDGQLAVVGRQDVDGEAGSFGLLEPGAELYVSDYQLSGYPRRILRAAKRAPDDSLVMVVSEGGRDLLIAYRADGTLKFSRALAPGSFFAGESLDIDSSGNHYIGGTAGSGWMVVKVSAAGTEVGNVRTLGLQATRKQVVVAPDGTIFHAGAGRRGVAWARYTSGLQLLGLFSENVTRDFVETCQVLTTADRLIFAESSQNSVAADETRVLAYTFSGALAGSYVLAGGIDQRTCLSGSAVWLLADTGANLELVALNSSNLSMLHTRTLTGIDPIGPMAPGLSGGVVLSYGELANLKLNWRDSAGNSTYEVAVEPTVLGLSSISVDAAGLVYVGGVEAVSTVNVYAAKYLANSVRSAQRRLAGSRAPTLVDASGSSVWMAGEVPTRKRNVGPYAARYTK